MKKEKIRFCKYCGGQIDMNQKQCTSCGKKFFKASRIISLRVLCIVELVAILLLTYTSIYWYNYYLINYNDAKDYLVEISDLKNQVTTLNNGKEISTKNHIELTNKYASLQTDKNELYKEYRQAKGELSSYQRDFAYFTASGNKYHKLNCSTLNMTNTLYCDCIYDLERRGYDDCDVCY